MLRILFALGATFGLCVSAPAALAALNPELDKPYHYRIVLRCATHPQLTEIFKERLQRELQDALRGALGDMAEVTITSKHPLLSEIEARGLQPALEGWKGEKDLKVQFVLVDLVDETYRIQTAQYDSMTGFASLVVRRAETDDREYVPRTIVRLIKPDFGLIGTVIDSKIDPGKIAVAIKGAKLGARLDEWVKKHDIFAVAQVRKAGAGEILSRVPGALLQVIEDPGQARERGDGILYCRLHQRYLDSLALRPGVSGFRCIKLGTTQAPLRLRFVDEKTLAPVMGLQVKVSQFGLDEADKIQTEGTTRENGALLAKHKDDYDNVAFVRVFKNGVLLARFPVEVLEDRVVTCKVPVESKTGPAAELNERGRRLLGQINETLGVHANLNKELYDVIRSNPKEALARAQQALTGLEADVNNFTEERINISKAAGGKKVDLAAIEQRLKDLRDQQGRLSRFIKDVGDSLNAQPIRQKALGQLAEARQMEEQADYESAIALYKQIEGKKELDEAERSAIGKRRRELEKAWQIKGKEHEGAREFIYKKWAQLDLTREIKTNLPEADKSFKACRTAGDRLTALKLKLVNDAIGMKLKERLDSLRPDIDDDKIETQMIGEIGGTLAKLQQEVLDFLKSADKQSKP